MPEDPDHSPPNHPSAGTGKFRYEAACRVCQAEKWTLILDLGHQPLANSLLKSESEPESAYPLTLWHCGDCGLLQIRETVDREILFSNYVWVTGTSSAAQGFAHDFCDMAVRTAGLKAGDFVLEIASNDGTFLKPFMEKGFNCLGVEPAVNITEISEKAGVPTLNGFWENETAISVRERMGGAKLVFARNVIPHVSDLHGAIRGMGSVLAEGGVGMIEFHYVERILNQLQYDSIYHEHLCYFSLVSMERLLARHDLHAFHCEPSPISGGALVVHFSKRKRAVTEHYAKLKKKEMASGLVRKESWLRFGKNCREHKLQTMALLNRYPAKKVVGFGASARSSTYLNFCGIGLRHMAAIIDNNPLKQGLFTAGTRLPIVSLGDGLAIDPELVFIIGWNFKKEIIASCKQAGYGRNFLIPFPLKPHLYQEPLQLEFERT